MKPSRRRKLRYIQVKKRKFAYYSGTTYLAIKEVCVKTDKPLDSFVFELQFGISERFGIRTEILRRFNESFNSADP